MNMSPVSKIILLGALLTGTLQPSFAQEAASIATSPAPEADVVNTSEVTTGAAPEVKTSPTFELSIDGIKDALHENVKNAPSQPKREASISMEIDTESDLAEMLIPLAAIGSVFGGPVLIVFLCLFYNYRKARSRNETLIALAERGVDVSLFEEKDSGPYADLRRGLTLLSVGVGICIFFLAAGKIKGVGIGAVPALMGLALILVYRIRIKSGK